MMTPRLRDALQRCRTVPRSVKMPVRAFCGTVMALLNECAQNETQRRACAGEIPWDTVGLWSRQRLCRRAEALALKRGLRIALEIKEHHVLARKLDVTETWQLPYYAVLL